MPHTEALSTLGLDYEDIMTKTQGFLRDALFVASHALMPLVVEASDAEARIRQPDPSGEPDQPASQEFRDTLSQILESQEAIESIAKSENTSLAAVVARSLSANLFARREQAIKFIAHNGSIFVATSLTFLSDGSTKITPHGHLIYTDDIRKGLATGAFLAMNIMGRDDFDFPLSPEEIVTPEGVSLFRGMISDTVLATEGKPIRNASFCSDIAALTYLSLTEGMTRDQVEDRHREYWRTLSRIFLPVDPDHTVIR